MGWDESGQCKAGITFVIQPVVRIITKPGTDTTEEAIKKHRLEKVTHLWEIDVSICYIFSRISHGEWRDRLCYLKLTLTLPSHGLSPVLSHRGYTTLLARELQ